MFENYIQIVNWGFDQSFQIYGNVGDEFLLDQLGSEYCLLVGGGVGGVGGGMMGMDQQGWYVGENELYELYV